MSIDFSKEFDCIHRGKMERKCYRHMVSPKKPVIAIIMLNKNTEAMVRSPDGDTNFFDIVTGGSEVDTLEPYMFIIYLDYVLRTSTDLIKWLYSKKKKKKKR